MAEKILVTFSIDEELFFEFARAVKKNNLSREDVIEFYMRYFVNESNNKPVANFDSNNEQPTKNPTTVLLDKCSSYKVGELANIVLRKLLELGVATEREVIEFQKASGATQVDRLHIAFGRYVKDNFGLSFPLLITPQRLQYDVGNNFYTISLFVGGQKFYLCSQWVESLHREKLEAWIRKHLPIWFAQSDENSRNQMIRWIESL